MPIAFVSITQITQLFVTGWTINVPAGVQAGDLLVSVLGENQQTGTTLPGGWTLATALNYSGTNRSLTVAYKIAGPSEPASYTFTLNAAADGAHLLACYRDTDQGATINVGPVTSTALATTNIVLPTMTTTVNGCLALWVAGDNNANALGASGGTTVRGEQFNATAFNRAWLADETIASKGATGTRTATTGGAAVDWGAISIALNADYPSKSIPRNNRSAVYRM